MTLGRMLKRMLGITPKTGVKPVNSHSSGCIISGRRLVLIAIASISSAISNATVKPEDIMAVTATYAGQNYGDSIYFSVLKPNKVSGKYYELVDGEQFISTIGSNKCFLFKWYPRNNTASWKSNAARINLDNEGNQFKTAGSGVSKTVQTIESAGLPIYTSSGTPAKILSLFDESVINSGFILAVVDSNLQFVYDLTDQVTWYSKQGAVRSWDGKTYETTWAGYEIPSYEMLDDRGNKMLAEDLAYGVNWIEEKRNGNEAIAPTIANTNSTYNVEKVVVNNVEYYYVTNKTIIVDPKFVGLDSVLDFTYPKYSVEGSNGVYVVNRAGTCFDALTIHVLTNGYFCGNLSWKSGESGKRYLKINYPVENEFNDNRPLEILIKSLNRKVGTRISEE